MVLSGGLHTRRRKTGSFGEKMEELLLEYEEQVKIFLMHYIDVECEQWTLTPPYAYLVFVWTAGEK